MSWKLAELSWRQELGLYESRWEMQSGGVSTRLNDPVGAKNGGSGRCRSRSGTTDCRPPNAACEAEGSLGAPLSETHRLSTICHTSNSPSSSCRKPIDTPSTVPLLQSFDSALFTGEAQDEGDRRSCASSTPKRRSQSCFALGLHLPPDLDLRKPDICPSPAFKHVDRSPLPDKSRSCDAIASQGSLQIHLDDSAPGASSSDLREKLLWPALSDSLHFDPFHPLSRNISQNVGTIDSPTFDYLSHFLEHEGAIFEILNQPQNTRTASVSTPEDSAQTQFASTESKHRSSSLLLPSKMASTDRNTGGGPNGVNGVNGSHRPSVSQVRTIEEMYQQYRHTFEAEGPCAPPNSLEHGSASDPQATLSIPTLPGEADNGGDGSDRNARVQLPQNASSTAQQGQGASSASSGSAVGNGARTHQALGPPPNIPLPTLPATPYTVALETPHDSSSGSGQYGRTSDILGMMTVTQSVREPEPDKSSTPASTARSASNDMYRGPSLSDIIEDPTENDFGREGSELSDNSGSTVQPLLPAGNSSDVGDVYSAPSIEKGRSGFVARDNQGGTHSVSPAYITQDQDWETTEEEEESGCHDQTVLKTEIPEVPLPSLPSDTSLLVSQNIVSTWDPLSAKNTLGTLPEATLADKLEVQNKAEEKPATKRGVRLQSRFTESLPAAQTLPDRILQAVTTLAQPVNSFNKPTSPTSAIHLRNLVKRKAAKEAKMPKSSTKFADCSYTTKNEPFSDFESASPTTKRARTIARVQAVARLYDPEARCARKFPNARLTIDRRHRVLNDPRLIAAQRKVGRLLLIFGTVFYPFGGLLLINSMANGGEYSHNAMIESCKAMGFPVVGSVGADEQILAQKIENYMFWVFSGVLVAILAMMVYFLAA